MKLWLLEILACPLDKAFPLELTILGWQNPNKTHPKLTHLLEGYATGQVLFSDMESPIKFIIEDSDSPSRPKTGAIINDELIIKPTLFREYLAQIIEKIGELDVVHDVSIPVGEEILSLIRTTIKTHLSEALAKLSKSAADEGAESNIFEDIRLDLELINLYKYYLEIEDAVIVCPECHRWYPVFEAIPQLLPDGIRKPEEDATFVEKWGSKFSFPASS
ncbi:MAG: Trm112 family protein [Promethearchaeota archaeon]